MKKVVVTIICLIIIITSSILGYFLVSANTEVEIEENIIEIQNDKEEYLKSYGYTIDNPNIIINPYDISPLTALIIFETKEEEEVFLTIVGKTNDTTITNTFEKSKVHYIPIYGLYPDYTNQIIIKCGNDEKIIELKTDKLPKDLTNIETNDTNKPLFITTDTIPYMLDKNNEVRWYLTKEYKGKISYLTDGNILLSTDKNIENESSTGLIEIDLLGKIHKEYQIPSGYYGSYTELDNTLFILSDNILQIDKQTGSAIKEIKLTDTYDTININNNILSLTNKDKKLNINLDTEEENLTDNTNNLNENKINLDLYNSNKNYKIESGIVFESKEKTQTSNQKVFLINYKKPDNNYKEYDIKLIKEKDRLVVSGNFSKEDEVIIILDKFLDKNVYKVQTTETTTYKYINKQGLEGKYSIYIKINDKLYKTNKYVTF